MARRTRTAVAAFAVTTAAVLTTALTAVPAHAVSHPLTTQNDYDEDGDADVLVRDDFGRLWLYAGTGAGTPGDVTLMATGLQAVEIVAPGGDLDDDGHNDVLLVNDGTLYLLRGDGDGGVAAPPVFLSRGWGRFSELAVFDVNHDGFDDLYGLSRTQGEVWLYYGRTGLTLAPGRIMISAGAERWDNLTPVGRWGYATYDQIIVRETATGRLLAYPLLPDGSFATRSVRVVGTGFGAVTEITGSNFLADAQPNLLARTTGGDVVRYDGRANGSLGRAQLVDRGFLYHHLL